MPWHSLLTDSELVRNALATALLLLVMLAVRTTVVRRLRSKTDVPPETLRRWIVNARNGALVVLAFGMVVIWSAELRSLALSIVAIAAAIVIATKELILCLSGAFYRASSRAFSVGDRIEVAGHRGVVIDGSFLTTTLLELTPTHEGHTQTGRSVVLPNAVFLNGPILNESFGDNHVFHAVRVPLNLTDDLPRAESLLLDAARAETGRQRNMKERWEQFFKTWGLPVPSFEPEVSWHLREPGRVDLVLRFASWATERHAAEQAIVRRFVREFSAVTDAAQPPAPGR
jgi:small-conductance mechanosensitive channel